MKKRKKEWFDDAWYWRKLYPFMFQEKDMAEVEARMAKALKLAKPAAKTVLDLCCGEGRYSIALAKKGLAVTGVDKTKYLLTKARGNARSARVRVEWIREDMRDFVRPDCFGLVLSMFSSFGYFADQREDVGVLQNIFASLKPGGVLLLDLRNGRPLAKLPKTPISHQLPDGSRLIERREKFGDSIRTHSDWFVKRNGRVQRFTWTVSVYSSSTVAKMLKQSGFRDVRLYGSLEGERYGAKSQRLIAVARKPAARALN
jgi:SAM-dependent methyltransferase